ncbi:nucleotidyltransferase [Pseudotabrizicola sp.]|uniref:nucleotidyltransferase domain-containing protein n=1 Tax=Pseudotabrizicola sp. TaxID=2939647 RepID=UPI002715E8BA|nr:nucleotidyltransferase [Pseudotabrizicola sp.]MDO8883295.1 nucleotidyltransferase [Pseudotabrizicola sp.]
MAVPEEQLATWAKQGSVTQSASTYQTVKAALEDPSAPFHNRTFDVFLQGSYGNDTNIYADSDVDIAIRLSSTVYADTSKLEGVELQRYKNDFSRADYQLTDFKADVLAWLRHKFGNSVDPGKKAIRIPANGSRRDADVLVCAQHLNYGTSREHYHDGIIFWTTDGVQIVNYPKQHLQNCTSMNQATYSRFKANVRVVKNLRNRMIHLGKLKDDIAPSYFLEGMLWNAPNQLYTGSYQTTFENYMSWLEAANHTDLTCANGIHWLLREGHPVCWRKEKFDTFRLAAIQYWKQPNH